MKLCEKSNDSLKNDKDLYYYALKEYQAKKLKHWVGTTAWHSSSKTDHKVQKQI